MAIEKCTNHDEFFRTQIEDLRRELKDNRWYLGEEENRDVGEMYSRKVFMEKYFESWAENFRLSYCQDICTEDENGCEFYQVALRQIQKSTQE